jgi:hypothetical protein
MKKTFDCVRMMRDIRAKLSRRYCGNPALEMTELREARERFEACSATHKPDAVAETPPAYAARRPKPKAGRGRP